MPGTATIDADSNPIINVPTPTTNDMAANKAYVDSVIPSVPAWALESTKPTYTAAEVGALPDTTVIPDISGKVNKSGDTMTGDLQFADSKGIILSYSGHTSTLKLTGYLASGYNIASFSPAVKLRGIDVPDVDEAAANKKYVDYQTAFVKTTAGSDNTEYNLIGTATSNTNTSAVNVYNPGSISFAKTTNEARLTLGSSSLPGKIRLYSNVTNATGYTDLVSGSTSTNTRTITFPDKTGTVALTSDIPSVPNWAMQSSKPSYTFSELTSHPTTINDYGITDAYTKTEVDGLVSGVLHYKGAKANTSALPSSGNAIGDVWHITADGSEWAWDGAEWQELGSTVDLSGYLQTGDIAAWAKASTKPSYTASEVGALPSNTTYVSTFNGQSGAITYIPPVTSVNGQTGAVTIVEDDKTWNGVGLNKSEGLGGEPFYVPAMVGASATTAYIMKALSTPTAGKIAIYDSSKYLKSTTPSANDNSTKVATTAYVDNAISNTPNEVLIVNIIDENLAGNYTFDKTYTEISTAIENCVPVFVYDTLDNVTTNVVVSGPDSLKITFSYIGTDGSIVLDVYDITSNNTVTYHYYYISHDSSTVAEHTHGNITNAGDITTNVAIASGDRLVINDESASKINNSSITFGSSTTQYLANNGTWQNAPAAYDDTALAARVAALEAIPWVTYHTGNSTPSNSFGNNGDLYLEIG